MNFGKIVNEIGYRGKLQIGVTDASGRVIAMLEISANDAKMHLNEAKWLEGISQKMQIFNDDT